ncbi:MAG: DUF350 domain-containing protein [Microscillaceae bacterium]|nr:DUF350 domain-containing protein [Microscillaceae bacterium]MDW8460097.1 DUF350 domain-containing protein [Cytophagales bacterium]
MITLQVLLAANIETGILGTLLYSAIGIAMAVLAYKILDWVTPGKLTEKIFEGNIAASILAGALILGICLIIAAVIHSPN